MLALETAVEPIIVAFLIFFLVPTFGEELLVVFKLWLPREVAPVSFTVGLELLNTPKVHRHSTTNMMRAITPSKIKQIKLHLSILDLGCSISFSSYMLLLFPGKME